MAVLMEPDSSGLCHAHVFFHEGPRRLLFCGLHEGSLAKLLQHHIKLHPYFEFGGLDLFQILPERVTLVIPVLCMPR